jgi:hypothetical protein
MVVACIAADFKACIPTTNNSRDENPYDRGVLPRGAAVDVRLTFERNLKDKPLRAPPLYKFGTELLAKGHATSAL